MLQPGGPELLSTPWPAAARLSLLLGPVTSQAWFCVLELEGRFKLHKAAKPHSSFPAVWACKVPQAQCTAARGPVLLVAHQPCHYEPQMSREIVAAVLHLDVRAWKRAAWDCDAPAPLTSVPWPCRRLLTCAPFLQLNVQLKRLSSKP